MAIEGVRSESETTAASHPLPQLDHFDSRRPEHLRELSVLPGAGGAVRVPPEAHPAPVGAFVPADGPRNRRHLDLTPSGTDSVAGRTAAEPHMPGTLPAGTGVPFLFP